MEVSRIISNQFKVEKIIWRDDGIHDLPKAFEYLDNTRRPGDSYIGTARPIISIQTTMGSVRLIVEKYYTCED